MLLILILILSLLLFVYLLFIPIIMVIDTRNHKYYVKLKGLAKATIIADEKELLKIKLRVLFFNFNFYPLKKKPISKSLKKQSKLPKKKSKKPINFETGIRVIKSFKIKQFNLNIDTGDCITNAKLYPLFALINFYKGTHFSINFESRNSVLLSVEIRPFRVITSYINI